MATLHVTYVLILVALCDMVHVLGTDIRPDDRTVEQPSYSESDQQDIVDQFNAFRSDVDPEASDMKRVVSHNSD